MKGKQYRIVVKDLSKLAKYGFVKIEKPSNWSGDYKYRYEWYSGQTDSKGELVNAISVRDGDKKIYMMTCGGAAIKVVCEMFRDGVIEFQPAGMSNEKRIKLREEKIKKMQKEIEALKNG